MFIRDGMISPYTRRIASINLDVHDAHGSLVGYYEAFGLTCERNKRTCRLRSVTKDRKFMCVRMVIDQDPSCKSWLIRVVMCIYRLPSHISGPECAVPWK